MRRNKPSSRIVGDIAKMFVNGGVKGHIDFKLFEGQIPPKPQHRCFPIHSSYS